MDGLETTASCPQLVVQSNYILFEIEIVSAVKYTEQFIIRIVEFVFLVELIK